MSMSREDLKAFARQEMAELRGRSRAVIRQMRAAVDPKLAAAADEVERRASALAAKVSALPAANVKATVAAMTVAGAAMAPVAASAEQVRLRVEGAQLVDRAVHSTVCVRDERLAGIAEERLARNWVGRVLGGGAGVAVANAAGVDGVGRVLSGAVGAVVGDQMQEGRRNRRLAEQDHMARRDGDPCPPGQQQATQTRHVPATLVSFSYGGQAYEVVTPSTNVAVGDVLTVDTSRMLGKPVKVVEAADVISLSP